MNVVLQPHSLVFCNIAPYCIRYWPQSNIEGHLLRKKVTKKKRRGSHYQTQTKQKKREKGMRGELKGEKSGRQYSGKTHWILSASKTKTFLCNSS
jgi:hypothetical protein